MTERDGHGRPVADAPWRTAVAAMAGLLVAIAIVGAVGIVVNLTVHDIVERSIAFDVELEDNADDLRVAVLDVRHYHRNMLFDELTEPVISSRADIWRERYEALQAQLVELAELYRGVNPAGLPGIDQLQAAAALYYELFNPAVEGFDQDRPTAFQNASDRALQELVRLEEMTAHLDRMGEARAAAALAAIDRATLTGTLALAALLVGLGGVGGALAVAVLRMLQEQRRVAAAQQAAARQMAEVAQAKAEFIADASHELRTPLTVVRGNAEIGLAIGDGCGHGEILREIVDEATRMTRLVDDLLFLARTDAAAPTLEIGDVDAGDVVRRLMSRADVLTRERGARLDRRVSGDAVLPLDPARLEQAVLILVENAAKYGPPGGTVRLRADVGGGGLRLSVSDDGPGIPAEEIDRIFDRFYRVRHRGRQATGTGIGLSIARAIVQGHGGQIHARSAPGKGTTMEIVIPAPAVRVAIPRLREVTP